MTDKKKSKLTEAIVSALVFAVLGYWQYLHKLELDRRGIWIEGINEFRAVVESRTADRWTKSDHNNREREVLDLIFQANPELVRPPKLSFENDPISEADDREAISEADDQP